MLAVRHHPQPDAAYSHANNCCGVNPCRRATTETASPHAYLSATIRSSARRSTRDGVKMSSRRTASALDLGKSSLSDMCPIQIGHRSGWKIPDPYSAWKLRKKELLKTDSTAGILA
jgi:hypothetical protein